MSCPQIVEELGRRYNILVTRQAVWKFLRNHGIKRSHKEAMKVRVIKGRMDYEKVVNHTDYEARSKTDGFKNRYIFGNSSTKSEQQILEEANREIYRRSNMIVLNKELLDTIYKVKGIEHDADLAKSLGFKRSYITMIKNRRAGVSAVFMERFLRLINEHKSKTWSRFFEITDEPIR